MAAGWRGYHEIINDPFMGDTFNAPGYEAIFMDVKADVDRQREIVETANAEHDFRAEFERYLTQSAN